MQSPFFERFLFLAGPEGFRQKKLQNLDSTDIVGIDNSGSVVLCDLEYPMTN
jgi:hypothetical protein